MIKFEDNSKEVKKSIEKAKNKAYLTAGLFLQSRIIEYITKIRLVDTGRLRASITFATPEEMGNVGAQANEYRALGKTKDTLHIGTNVEYAPLLELGRMGDYKSPARRAETTKKQTDKPKRSSTAFLKPVIIKNIGKIKEIFAKEMAKIDD